MEVIGVQITQKHSKSEEGLSLVVMVNTLEFANDQPIHKEEKRGEEKYFFSSMCAY